MVLLCGVSLFLCFIVLSVWESLYIGLILGILAVFVSLILGTTVRRVVGYFVFLIYIGGLMVLFGYVLRVFPNQYFAFGFLPGKFLFRGAAVLTFVGLRFKRGLGLKLGSFLGFWGSAIIYLFIGGFLLYILILVVSLCKKRHLPLRGGLN